jgi:hypothetical protein
MARAIIHNSDYGSVDKAKEAIDRYFEERNRHFLDHPRRAGNKIWGKERVPPSFSTSNEAVLAAGKLNSREDIATGFATFPETLLKLFAGENFGKLVLTSPTPETGLSDCLGDHSLSMVSALRHRVFGSLHRASLDDLPRWLRLEYCRFFCEWIDALARLRGGLLDDNEFGESGHNEGSRFLEFLVANCRERLDDPFDVLPAHGLRILLSDFLNKLRLRHQFVGHVFSVISNHPVTTLA